MSIYIYIDFHLSLKKKNTCNVLFGLSYSINMLENRGKYLEYTLTTENMIYIYGIYIYTTVAIKIVDLPSNLPGCY